MKASLSTPGKDPLLFLHPSPGRLQRSQSCGTDSVGGKRAPVGRSTPGDRRGLLAGYVRQPSGHMGLTCGPLVNLYSRLGLARAR